MTVLDLLLGRPLASDEARAECVGPAAGIPIFGLDALSSAAYGPEAALTLLIPLGAAGIAYMVPISASIIVLLTIVYFSYRQTIQAYPGGSAALPPLRGRFGRSKSAEWPGYSIKWTSQEGPVIARIGRFSLTICPFLRQKGWIGCQRGPALAGREFFPFGCFEHRIMASGAGYTSIEGAADAGGDTGSSKSPALKPKRESGANLPRNIST
jgi:hypothetical protein